MSERCQPGRPCERGCWHALLGATRAAPITGTLRRMKRPVRLNLGADAFTPLRRTAGNLRICAAAMPNYSASTAGVMIGFASEIEAWVEDHERGETSQRYPVATKVLVNR